MRNLRIACHIVRYESKHPVKVIRVSYIKIVVSEAIQQGFKFPRKV